MAQIHLRLDDRLYEKLMNRAKECNDSIQGVAERALLYALNNPLPLSIEPIIDKTSAKQPAFTFIDLFAGIGGIRIAFEEQGGKCLFSSEWDRWCQKTYFENFGEMPAGDINKVDPAEIPAHDVLAAGFPCQPFSIAGVSKMKSLGREVGFKNKAQGTLFFRVAEILETKRPKAFLLENVKNLKNHDKGNTFKVIKGTLDELDYKIFYEVIDARHYVPQHRERLIVVGFDKRRYGDNIRFSFPEVPKRQPRLSSILEKKVDRKYVLTDKLWNYLQDYAAKHKEKGNGFGYGLVTGDSVTRTLSARYHKDGSEILVDIPNSNPRRLTPAECARLMGFDDERFRIVVSDTQAYRQFGNSVVVPLVAAVAQEVVKTLRTMKEQPRDL